MENKPADSPLVSPTAPAAARPPIQWRLPILAGIASAFVWFFLIRYGGQNLQLLAGVAPMLGGFLIGRRIKERALAHGVIMALTAALTALAIFAPLIFFGDATVQQGAEPAQGDQQMAAILFIGSLILMTLVPFSIYGVMISSRSAKRTEEFRKEIDSRGGQLTRAGRVQTSDDVQALTLPKFGYWVQSIFQRNGFKVEDYKFGKDVVDLFLRRVENDERWLVRCTVADGVKPGMVQDLSREIDSSEFNKGVVATSMTVQDGARKWAKGRRTVEVVDGETLLEIAS